MLHLYDPRSATDSITELHRRDMRDLILYSDESDEFAKQWREEEGGGAKKSIAGRRFMAGGSGGRRDTQPGTAGEEEGGLSENVSRFLAAERGEEDYEDVEDYTDSETDSEDDEEARSKKQHTRAGRPDSDSSAKSAKKLYSRAELMASMEHMGDAYGAWNIGARSGGRGGEGGNGAKKRVGSSDNGGLGGPERALLLFLMRQMTVVRGEAISHLGEGEREFETDEWGGGDAKVRVEEGRVQMDHMWNTAAAGAGAASSIATAATTTATTDATAAGATHQEENGAKIGDRPKGMALGTHLAGQYKEGRIHMACFPSLKLREVTMAELVQRAWRCRVARGVLCFRAVATYLCVRAPDTQGYYYYRTDNHSVSWALSDSVVRCGAEAYLTPTSRWVEMDMAAEAYGSSVSRRFSGGETTTSFFLQPTTGRTTWVLAPAAASRIQRAFRKRRWLDRVLYPTRGAAHLSKAEEWGEGGPAMAGRALLVEKQLEEAGLMLLDPTQLGEGGSLAKALNVALYRQSLHRTIDTNKGSAERFEEGEKVEVDYKGRGKHFPAMIARVYVDGKYDVLFEDGEREAAVEGQKIRSRHEPSAASSKSASPSAALAAGPTEVWGTPTGSMKDQIVPMHGHDLEGSRRTYDAMMRKAPWHPTLNWGYVLLMHLMRPTKEPKLKTTGKKKEEEGRDGGEAAEKEEGAIVGTSSVSADSRAAAVRAAQDAEVWYADRRATSWRLLAIDAMQCAKTQDPNPLAPKMHAADVAKFSDGEPPTAQQLAGGKFRAPFELFFRWAAVCLPKHYADTSTAALEAVQAVATAEKAATAVASKATQEVEEVATAAWTRAIAVTAASTEADWWRMAGTDSGTGGADHAAEELDPESVYHDLERALELEAHSLLVWANLGLAIELIAGSSRDRKIGARGKSAPSGPVGITELVAHVWRYFRRALYSHKRVKKLDEARALVHARMLKRHLRLGMASAAANPSSRSKRSSSSSVLALEPIHVIDMPAIYKDFLKRNPKIVERERWLSTNIGYDEELEQQEEVHTGQMQKSTPSKGARAEAEQARREMRERAMAVVHEHAAVYRLHEQHAMRRHAAEQQDEGQPYAWQQQDATVEAKMGLDEWYNSCYVPVVFGTGVSTDAAATTNDKQWQQEQDQNQQYAWQEQPDDQQWQWQEEQQHGADGHQYEW
jgi:hypothetical protein